MKHMSTWDLLDLALDYNNVATEFLLTGNMNKGRYLSAIDKLYAINTELLSRMPEGDFVTLLDDNGNPVGFEPECYVKLAEAQAELAQMDSHYQSPAWYQASH